MDTPAVRFSETPAGQPATPSPLPVQPAEPTSVRGAEPSTGNTAPVAAPLTAEQYREIARQEAQSAFRAQQSARDKAVARTERFVADLIASYEKSGVTLTDVQKAQLRTDTAQRFNQELEPSPDGTPASPTPAVTPGVEQPKVPEAPLSPAEKIALQAAQAAGYDIYANDPELAMVKRGGTEYEYVQSYLAALSAKGARLGPGARATNPQANLPILTGGGPGGNPIANINDTNELWKLSRKG